MDRKKIYLGIIALVLLGIMLSLIDYKFGIKPSLFSSQNFSAKFTGFLIFIFIMSLFLVGYIIGKIKKKKGIPIMIAIAIGIVYFGSVISNFLIYLPYHQKECRKVNSWDNFKECYIQKAKDKDDPMICSGITYGETYFIVPPGRYRGQYALFARSECFYKISELKNSTQYCKFVVHPYREKCYGLDFTSILFFE